MSALSFAEVLCSKQKTTWSLHTEGGDTLNRLPKEAVDAPISGGIQGQAGCGSGQPGLLVGDPAHSKGLERDEHCGPFQPRPFYDSMKVWFRVT